MGNIIQAAESDSSEQESNSEQNNQNEELETEESSEEHSGSNAESSKDDPEAQFKTYFSTSELPPELKEIGKKMLASHTKAMQKLKTDHSELEKQLTTEYSGALIKAKALDTLGKNPDFQLLIADLEANRPYGYSSNFNRGNGNVRNEEGGEGLEEDGDKVKLEALIERVTEKIIDKHLKPLKEERTKSIYETVSSKPFFEKNRVKITELVNDYGMPLEKAYLTATEKDRALEEAKLEVENAKKDVEKLHKKPRTEQPSNARSDTLSKKTIKNVRDALNLAWSTTEEK